VGLGTNGMARAFLEGPGSVFRALARLPAEKRPTHFAVYPSFFPGFESVFGRELARFPLSEPSIAADPLLVVYEARPDVLAASGGDGDPRDASACDAVEGADLASERAHDASYERLGTLVAPCPAPAEAGCVRAARVVRRASFRLSCPGLDRARLRATVAAGVPTAIEIEVDGRRVHSAKLPPGWSERVIPLESASARVRLTATPHVALSRLALEPLP
jgi:hypothetical protein